MYRDVVKKSKREAEDMVDQIRGLKMANRRLAEKLGSKEGLEGSLMGTRGTFLWEKE